MSRPLYCFHLPPPFMAAGFYFYRPQSVPVSLSRIDHRRTITKGLAEKCTLVAVMDTGRGPQYPWMRALDIRLQLWREDMESRMDEETRARFQFWLEQQEFQEERRRCQAFMHGVWYEREYPGVWKF